ncbi:MAG TPA: hypothetical protein VIL28_03980 [Steroidobacteraceae bacterium]
MGKCLILGRLKGMWFAKWFGGRKDDEEPSEHPPHPAARASKARHNTVRPSSHFEKKLNADKGFDPYNSGTFDKTKAWERVVRR